MSDRRSSSSPSVLTLSPWLNTLPKCSPTLHHLHEDTSYCSALPTVSKGYNVPQRTQTDEGREGECSVLNITLTIHCMYHMLTVIEYWFWSKHTRNQCSSPFSTCSKWCNLSQQTSNFGMMSTICHCFFYLFIKLIFEAMRRSSISLCTQL